MAFDELVLKRFVWVWGNEGSFGFDGFWMYEKWGAIRIFGEKGFDGIDLSSSVYANYMRI
jgi:hypothetical protein